MAACCVFVTVDMKIPIVSASRIKRRQSPKIRKILPLTGTWNTKKPTPMITTALKKARER